MIGGTRVDPGVSRLAVRLVAAGLVAASALAGAAPALAQFPAPPPKRPVVARTRVLPWSGGDRLGVAVDADVQYVPGADNKVVITGPSDLVDDIVVDHGLIRHGEYGSWWRWWRWQWGWQRARDVRIVVTAPHLSDVSVSGAGRLDLGHLAQDRLDLGLSGSGYVTASGQIKTLDLSVSGSGGAKFTGLNTTTMSVGLSGSGWVAATGTADTLRLRVSGSGSGNFTGLALNDLDAGLSGSGSAKASPKRSADVWVSGSGSVRLLTEPQHLNAHRSGSGRIMHPNEGT